MISFMLLAACEKENSDQSSDLENTGILGKWEIQSYTYNGITDMSINCCSFLEFNYDGIAHDLMGDFRAVGTGYETKGIFKLDLKNFTILFEYSNKQKLYEFQIQDSHLAFSYNEDGTEISETWIKLE
jgi:hypothetical protein